MPKSNVNNLLLIGGLGVAAWYFLTRYNTLNSLVFQPAGMGVQGGGISVRLNAQNPTNNPLTLQSFVGSLSVMGSPVGNVSAFQPQTIAPNSSSPVTLLITPNFFGISAGVIDQIDGNEGNGSIQATLQGTANVNGIPLPVNLNLI